jgi:hypothetical protein
MNPPTLPSADIDITSDLLAVRRALRILLNQGSFRRYLTRAFLKGPRSVLNVYNRDGKRHYTIYHARGNGTDVPFGTFLVLSIPHEAIDMSGFESVVKIHVRYTAEHDGFWKTRLVKNQRFRSELALCANPAHLEEVIQLTF